MRLALLLLLAPLLVRAQGLPGSQTVILRLEAESLYAHLFRPAARGRAPAMVIVQGFGGVSDTREGFWARELAAFGVAALVVESFTARGIGSSIDDQSRLSTAQGVRDAYAALGYLAQQDFIDPRRIGVMGMSWGGTVALRAADRRRQGQGPAFAVSIPLYPGCVAQYRNPQPGAPLLLLIGQLDDYTGIRTCVEYVERIRAAGGAAQVRVYRDAHHGFDDARAPEVFSAQTQSYRECVLYIEDDGTTTYGRTGELLDSAQNAFELMRRDCMRTGATVGGNTRARLEALQDVKAFLKTTLLH
ncbi:MAG TPA: dienelactone hydrolase family protein [Burkholderiales bacterium]|jgi:dienelactone hydrolase|nr:dienelactone hydrolase family protein [Burkholderiales bacterium]